jgi:hypothetical protein
MSIKKGKRLSDKEYPKARLLYLFEEKKAIRKRFVAADAELRD